MVYTANWWILCHLPPFTGTWNNHWSLPGNLRYFSRNILKLRSFMTRASTFALSKMKVAMALEDSSKPWKLCRKKLDHRSFTRLKNVHPVSQTTWFFSGWRYPFKQKVEMFEQNYANLGARVFVPTRSMNWKPHVVVHDRQRFLGVIFSSSPRWFWGHPRTMLKRDLHWTIGPQRC